MKDKLYKNNHRGIYYRIKALFFVFVLFASAMAIAVIPTYIVLKDTTKEASKAEPEVVETVEQEEETNDENEESPSLSYEQ